MVYMWDETLDFYMICYAKREVYVDFLCEESMQTSYVKFLIFPNFWPIMFY